MDYVEFSSEDLLEPYEPAWSDLQNAISESSFMEAAFYLLREASQLMALIASLKAPTPLDRNRAIIRGLVVRVAKLMRLAMRELHSQEAFLQLSIARDAMETLGTLRYLLDDDDSGIRFDQYVMNSLVTEREFLREVQNNVAQRDGRVWHIEERIRRSIAMTAAAAGIDDVSSLPGRQKIGFPSAEARIKLPGPTAYNVYRMGSTETHGDWADLFRNHLKYDNSEFRPTSRVCTFALKCAFADDSAVCRCHG